MKTGFSLWGNPHREKHVFIIGNPVLIAGILFSLQGFPYKTLYFPVRDCSVFEAAVFNQEKFVPILSLPPKINQNVLGKDN